jgi:geranylgeranyl diphosphate synthase type II
MKASMDIKEYFKEKAGLVNGFLEDYFSRTNPHLPERLREAMHYSITAGGKRLRPVLAMAAWEACGGRAEDVVQYASSLEIVHTYSLIHDDLPAMDDDDLRRGRPTNHKVYGEAIAILAGDGLLTEAFMMFFDAPHAVPDANVLAAIRDLAHAAGPRGMVGGQVVDMLSEGAKPDAGTLQYIHTHKTGALLRASVRMGGILYGADGATMDALTSYGEDMGLAFQIVDDILDIKGDESVLGKPVGSDLEKDKLTWPAVYGIDESMKTAEELIARAVSSLEPLGERAEALRAIARYILERTY